MNRRGLLLLLLAACLATSCSHATSRRTPAAVATPKLIDLNTARRADLVALPGIGEVYADKIIKGRPYSRKDQLVSKKILSPAAYAQIQGVLVVRQDTKAANKTKPRK